jgi:hypothetical protein
LLKYLWRSHQPVIDRNGLDQAIDLNTLAEAELNAGLGWLISAFISLLGMPWIA